MNPRDLLQAMFLSAVGRAHPREVIAPHLPPPPNGRTVVIGAGKAAAAMAYAVEEHWPAGHAISGAVVTRYDHVPPCPPGLVHRIDILGAAHPVPDHASVDAAERMRSEVAGLTSDDLVLCLMSGGASSLLVLPVEGLSLEQKQDINGQLLACGVPDYGRLVLDARCHRSELSSSLTGQRGRTVRPHQLEQKGDG